jgi:hypothetical protein
MPDGSPLILSGVCYVLFAYDIGLAVNLEEAARRVTDATEPETIRHKRRVPEHFEYRPAPLRVILTDGAGAAPPSIAGFTASGRVECVIYDFGAASVTYAIPISGPLDSLLPLSDALYENRALLEDSRRRVGRLLTAIAPAVDRAHIADPVEDYAIFQIESLGAEGEATPAGQPAAVLERHRRTLAQILRAEPGSLSDQEVEDALSTRISYVPGEEVIVDWNAAIILQRDAEDARAVLEYANVELLELRRLDDQLDVVLDRSYQLVARRSWRRYLGFSSHRAMSRIATLQMDSALLFEGVNNALKLIGDQYLARLYRLAAQRLHLPDWDASILRKLQTAESIYSKLSDRQASLRMEVLEWIVIVLIALEVVMSLVRH